MLAKTEFFFARKTVRKNNGTGCLVLASEASAAIGKHVGGGIVSRDTKA
jgi:hypothetical protein